MKKLLKLMREYKKETVAAPAFKLLEASFELLVPLVVAGIIDRGIGIGDKGYAAWMCLLLVALGIVGLASTVAAQYFAAKASAGFVRAVRQRTFEHINNLSFSQTDELGASTLITRMTSDANQVQTGMNLTLRLALRSPFIVLGAAVMAFTVDVSAALVFLAVIPVLAAVIFVVMLVCLPMYKRVQQQLDSVVLSVRENLKGVRVLRAFCLEKKETEDFQKKNGELAGRQIKTGRVASLLNPLTFVIINLGIVWLIHAGALRVEAGLLTQGAVVALYNYMSQILAELIKLANLIINITKSVASANRIQAVLDIEPQQRYPDKPAVPQAGGLSVEFCNAGVRYGEESSEGGMAALHGVSLGVKRGESIGIIGGTGSGKSTMVSLIPRFYDCFEGAVKVNGVDVKEYPKRQLASLISLVPQKSVLFKGTVRQNLLWGREDASDEELLSALEAASARDFVDQKGGLDFMLAAGAGNLSGGQRQRLAIARAFVRNAEILILDDSFSALDNLTGAKVKNSIRNINATVFTVAQRTKSIQDCDKIVVLDGGCVKAIGTHEQLLASCDVYSEIYASQEEAGA